MAAIGILYVEDNDDLRESIAMMLEADDRDITSCATGEEALAALQRRDYDILITDVSLPGISGTDLAKRVTADKPDQWVVLCSGYQFDHGLKTLGKNVRAILKPFEIEDMDTMLAEIIAKLPRN
jgi:YesN/AraC family two-component response regulator